MVTILLQKILDLLKGWLLSFTSWAEDVASKLGLIEEQTEYIDDISENTDSIAENTLGIKTDTGVMKITLNNANARLTQIYSDTSTIKNNSGSIATSAGTAAAFAEDCATNGLNILDKVTTIASDTTQMRADNAVVKSDLDKIYDAIRWSLINVLMTETESGSSPLVFDTDKAELINDLVCNIALTETGSGTKSPSNPYTISSISNLNVDVNGNTFTFALGQTVYGGSFDVITGKLNITHGSKTYSGGSDEAWAAYVAGNGYYINIPEMKSGNNLPSLSNSFPQYSGVNDIGLRYGFNNTYAYCYQANTITSVTDLASWKTWLSNNPLTMVYELAIPIESTLTPQAITALIGLNTISSNGNGDISVTYTESVKHYLDKQEA